MIGMEKQKLEKSNVTPLKSEFSSSTGDQIFN